MSRPGDAVRLAVGTLTVLPVRPPHRVDPTVGGLAMALAPVAVLPLAVVAAAVAWLGGALSAPPLLVAVLTVSALAVGTGGLHLDGLADTVDGLAVQGGPARRLEVMRRGDVGPVGAASLLLVLLVQVSALAGVVSDRRGVELAVAVALAVVVSRGVLVLGCARGVPPARPEGLGSAVVGSVALPLAALVVAVLAAASGLVLGLPGLAGSVLAMLTAGLVLLRARRRLGGVTGDVLGACVEVALAGYLVALAL